MSRTVKITNGAAGMPVSSFCHLELLSDNEAEATHVTLWRAAPRSRDRTEWNKAVERWLGQLVLLWLDGRSWAEIRAAEAEVFRISDQPSSC